MQCDDPKCNGDILPTFDDPGKSRTQSRRKSTSFTPPIETVRNRDDDGWKQDRNEPAVCGEVSVETRIDSDKESLGTVAHSGNATRVDPTGRILIEFSFGR